MSRIEERMKALEFEVIELRKRTEELEEELGLHQRLSAPYQPITTPLRQPTWIVPNTCSVCGLKFDGPMGYVCGNPRCPSGVSCCGSSLE